MTSNGVSVHPVAPVGETIGVTKFNNHSIPYSKLDSSEDRTNCHEGVPPETIVNATSVANNGSAVMTIPTTSCDITATNIKTNITNTTSTSAIDTSLTTTSAVVNVITNPNVNSDKNGSDRPNCPEEARSKMSVAIDLRQSPSVVLNGNTHSNPGKNIVTILVCMFAHVNKLRIYFVFNR